MKKSLFSKIAPWIWRGAALLLVIYFLVAVFAEIPFFFTDVGAEVVDGGESHAVAGLAGKHIVEDYRTFVNSMALDINLSFPAKFICAAAPSIICASESFYGISVVLYTDNLIFEKPNVRYYTEPLYTDDIIFEKSDDGYYHDHTDTVIIGLRKPRQILDNGKTMGVDAGDFFRYIRSYSSPMLPVIDTGSAVWGMLLLIAIPILLSFVYSRFCGKVFSGSQKAVLFRGAKVKLVVAVCLLMLFGTATMLFYLTRPSLLIAKLFPLIRWLTPIISIPALSVWVASFKNKKFAPVVAAAIMVLCLYQPLANLICLFATVIAWGYFAHGVCRFFGRFRKAKAEAV